MSDRQQAMARLMVLGYTRQEAKVMTFGIDSWGGMAELVLTDPRQSAMPDNFGRPEKPVTPETNDGPGD